MAQKLERESDDEEQQTQLNIPSTPAKAVVNPDMSKQLMAFASLVIIQGSNILFFKLSGAKGKYSYNTASAICITEAVKFCMSIVFFTRERIALPSVPMATVRGYIILAVIYCVNNQLTFWLLSTLGAGQLQMGKSVAPMLTATLLWVFYNEPVNKCQWACLVIFVCGLIGVMGGGSPVSDFFTSVTTSTCAMLVVACNLTAFSSVFNAKMLQKDQSLSINVQNGILYFFGTVFNLFCYAVGFTPSDPNLSFFTGMDNWNVLMVLLSQAFIGLAISLVYKYGGAIVKTLAAGVQAAILSVVDSVFFGFPATFGSVAGTVTVLATSYLYFTVALSLPKPENENPTIPRQTRIYGYIIVLFAYLIYVAYVHHSTIVPVDAELTAPTRRLLLARPEDYNLFV